MKCLTVFSHLILSACLCSAMVWGQSTGYTIQVASVVAEAEAQALVRNLQARGLEAYWVKADVPGIGTRYRIRVGRFLNQAAARQKANEIRNQGLIEEFIIVEFVAPKGAMLARRGESAVKSYAREKSDLESGRTKNEPVKTERNEVASAESKKSELVADKVAQPPQEATPVGISAPTAEKQPASQNEAPASTVTASVKPETGGGSGAVSPESKEPAASPPISGKLVEVAQPPMAGALIEVSLADSKWEIVRRGPPTDKNLQAVYFVDSLTGWVAGEAGTIYRTNDGGRSWKALLSPVAANITRIQFIDWNRGWMIGEVESKTAAESETILLRTTNGGRSWQLQMLPNVLSLHFINARQGWAVGRSTTLLKTEDGGQSWQPYEGIEKLVGRQVAASPYNFGFCDVHFVDAEHGWIVGNFYGRVRTHIGGLFATTDGGQSWHRVRLDFQLQSAAGPFITGLLHSVRFTDVNTGLVTGEMYDGGERFFFVLHTSDGGKTWKQYRTPSRAAHRTQFLDQSYGWTAAAARREGAAEAVVYDTTLLRTEDGGLSWRADFVAHGGQIRRLFFLSPARGWAVGDHGLILRYEDRSRSN
jgi:photosystem II stability/assembly factor-like uncharacterized protein